MNIRVRTSIAVLIALSSGLLATQYASAQSPSDTVEQAPDEGLRVDRRARSELFLGYYKWDQLAQLSSAGGGSFNANGVSLGGASHWSVAEWGRSDILAGFDFALFSNESNVRHVSEDVISRGLYITPSIKLMFDNGTGPRYSLDFGLGYYLVDIAEVISFNGGYSEDELWEDSAFGGYVGATVDFPTKKSNWERGFFMSAKVHYFDLGKVADEGFVFSSGTLGSDAGNLSGPVVMLQFGYHMFTS